MNRENIGGKLLAVFVATLVGYIAFYQLDRWLRLRHGAWEVTFSTDGGTPSLTIAESKLKIPDVKLAFAGETSSNLTASVHWRFDDVTKTNLPFGHVVFLDLTYLPGGVTMNFFGHEIEMLPRTLVVNRKEVPWESGKTITLKPEEKLPPDPAKKKSSQY